MVVQNLMAVDALIVHIVTKVPAHPVLAVPMVTVLKKVTRDLEKTGAGAERRSRTTMAKRRRLDRVSTALTRILVKNAPADTLVLRVIVILFSMKNLVPFAKLKVKICTIRLTSAGFQRADTLHRVPYGLRFHIIVKRITMEATKKVSFISNQPPLLIII